MLEIKLKPIEKMLEDYLQNYKEESDRIKELLVFIQDKNRLEIPFQRGHLTGSAWLINKNRDKILLTHHNKLNRWLQLGGHLESGEHAIEAAYRECLEESGIKNIKILDEKIFDIDIHMIPKYKNEEEHYHYDIRFIFEADSNEKLLISSESKDLKWIDLKKIAQYNNDESIVRMIEKTNIYKKEVTD